LRDELDRLREVANESYLEIRSNLALLHDEAATDLNQIVASYVSSITPEVPFALEFETSGTPSSLGPLTRQHILGLIQESMTNIQKHAQAQHVRLALLWRTDRLDVAVTDDGVGFDPEATPLNGHYGLIMLRERIQELHGDMQINAAPGAGTSVQFSIPFRTL
jgi:signal transduction histidine kinase